MGTLRVLFDFSLASDEPAGGRTLMDGLLRGWAEAYPHDDVTVFGPPSLRARGADFELIPARVELSPRRIWQQQVELPLRRLSRATDVVVVPGPACTLAPLAAPIVGTLCDVRHLRRPDEFSRASRLFRRAVWTASAHVMAGVASISEFSLQEADELGFTLPSVRSAVPLGLDHVRRPEQAQAKSNTVVCVGHRSSKGLHAVPAVWASAQAALGADCPSLVLTGVAPDRRPELVQRLAAAGVVDGFRITDFLPGAELHRAIAEARAVLSLSAYEGYGLVPSEATVLGTHSFVYDLAPYRERASQLSVTTAAVDDTAAIARKLIAFLRATETHPFNVAAAPPPRWADTAAAYRALIERVVSASSRN